MLVDEDIIDEDYNDFKKRNFVHLCGRPNCYIMAYHVAGEEQVFACGKEIPNSVRMMVSLNEFKK